MIELAVVLVIIGLIAGGIIAGREMIHQARLRAVISDSHNIQIAVRVYKLKYNALPGDHNQAATFLLGQVNGDGNKMIEGAEIDSFFDHLAAARIFDAPRTQAFIKVMQSSSYSDRGIQVRTALGWENRLSVGFSRIQPGITPIAHQKQGGFMTPADGYAIDLKIDDGNGSTGKLIGLKGHGHGVTWSDCSTLFTSGIIVDWRSTKDDIRGCQVWHAF